MQADLAPPLLQVLRDYQPTLAEPVLDRPVRDIPVPARQAGPARHAI